MADGWGVGSAPTGEGANESDQPAAANTASRRLQSLFGIVTLGVVTPVTTPRDTRLDPESSVWKTLVTQIVIVDPIEIPATADVPTPDVVTVDAAPDYPTPSHIHHCLAPYLPHSSLRAFLSPGIV